MIVKTLPNGLQVILVNDDSHTSCPCFYAELVGRAGRRAENHNEVGFAHLSEHLFFNGTHQNPSHEAIQESLEDFGGYINGITSPELVKYVIRSHSDNSIQSLRFLFDIFQNSLLTTDSIKKERNIIRQEALSKSQSPPELLKRNMLKEAFRGTSLGRTILDEIDSPCINRKRILSFIERNYVSHNFVLVISCSYNCSKDVLLEAENLFSQVVYGQLKEYTPTIT